MISKCCIVSSQLLYYLEQNLILEHTAFCSNNTYSSSKSKVLALPPQMVLMETVSYDDFQNTEPSDSYKYLGAGILMTAWMNTMG